MARDLDLCLGPERGLGEAHLEVVAEVGAALSRAPGTPALPEDLPEDVTEDVVDIAGETGLEGARAESAGRLVTEAVVPGALLPVAEDFVGLGSFLEPVLGGLVAGVLVGVVLNRELAEGALQFL